MNSKQRFYTAISGGIPDRVPVVPKIWVDLASRSECVDCTAVVNDPEAPVFIQVHRPDAESIAGRA